MPSVFQNAQKHEKVDSKEQVKAAYKKLITILDDVSHDIKELKGVNTPFNSIQSKVVSILEDKTKEVRKECKDALTMTVWDKLVIAFFGTTNAGKSTIIETFRILFDDKRKREDGLIVGDGQSDFTKTYEEYSLQIDGVPFTLIDVPGIEGNESEYTDKIAEALRKAHIVFYIQGEDKKPDAATAEKIKKYLGDWVNVYSIYNVRAAASKYARVTNRVTLLTDKVLKQEKEIKETFTDILGDVYAGHITLQAFLAMCAKAEFSPKREDLIRNQQKLLTAFADEKEVNKEQLADKILRFSQFATVTSLVKERAGKFMQEINEANKRKLISLASRINGELATTISEQNESIEFLKGKLTSFKREICDGAFTAAKNNIGYLVDNKIEKAYNELQRDLANMIDNKEKKEKIIDAANKKQEVMIWNLNRSISDIAKKQISQLTDKAERKHRNLDGVSIPRISFGNIDDIAISIDFSGAVENLDFDIADAADWVADAAGAAAVGAGIGAWGGPAGMAIGAGIGAIGGAIGHAFIRNDGKSDAKDSITKAIEEAIQQTKEKTHAALTDLMKRVDSQKRTLQSAIQRELNNLQDFSASIEQVSAQLNSFVKKLNLSQYGKL